MKLIKAAAKDFAEIKEFYKSVIDNTDNMSEYARWEYGKHPTDEMIRGYIDCGSLLFCEDNGRIVAAVVCSTAQGEEYRPVGWGVNAEDGEVAVVRLLAVDPKMQKRGLAKKVMGEVIALAREQNKKAVRLDALRCNAPAHRLYESLGFTRRGVANWYAENTGRIDFYLYEYVL